MKIKVILFVLLSILFTGIPLYACTIFYVVKDNKIFAGNNEDWENPSSKMWFYPAENNKHGWIKFGWGSGFPQGGMNDQGIFWDASSGAYLAMPISEATKEKYTGALMQKVIEECANIEEVLEIFANYYCEDQYRAQYLVGDSLGNSIIVEGDNIINIASNFQVLTNFYHSHTDLGGYPCWRYETAKDMLSSNYNLTPYFIGSILDATHQEGRYPTQYSNIYDLKNNHIFLFHYYNYEEFIKIDLVNELNQGYRSFDIPDLFSRVKLLTPEDGEEIESTSVTLSWEGIPGNNYEVILYTDPEFLNNNSKYQVNTNSGLIVHSGFLYFLPGLLLVIPWIRKKRIPYFSMMILLAVLLNSECTKSEIPTPEIQVVEMTKTISNLSPNSTYYWKIKAHALNQDDFYSETLTRCFNTGSSVVLIEKSINPPVNRNCKAHTNPKINGGFRGLGDATSPPITNTF